MTDPIPNPVGLQESPKRPLDADQQEAAHPPKPVLLEELATKYSEEIEKNGVKASRETVALEEPSAKRVKVGEPNRSLSTAEQDRHRGESGADLQAGTVEDKMTNSREKVKGIALVKPE